MTKIITLITFLLFTAGVSAQRTYDQYSAEIEYGYNSVSSPQMSGMNHIGVGLRYMLDEYWGFKVEYANDRFRTDDVPKLGTNYNRFTLQGVHNLGRTLDIPYSTGDRINLLAHAGLGYSALQSLKKGGIDNIGHVIVGLTPQVFLTESVSLNLDLSYIFNFSQHYNYDGTYPTGSLARDQDKFTGNIINASVGFTFYFGKNGSDPDWR